MTDRLAGDDPLAERLADAATDYLALRAEIAKLIEAIDHLRRDGNDSYADRHADLLVARIKKDWSF